MIVVCWRAALCQVTKSVEAAPQAHNSAHFSIIKLTHLIHEFMYNPYVAKTAILWDGYPIYGGRVGEGGRTLNHLIHSQVLCH
jgi:hypothetical protein